MSFKNFRNYLLISTPGLSNSIFRKSTILVCEHDKNGAMGLIINKPIVSDGDKSSFLKDIFSTMNIKSKIYFGGPVNIQNCFVLHDSSYLSNDTIELSSEISLTSNDSILDDIKNNIGPKNYKINMGYAGWDKGQLEDEIKNGDWLLKPITKNFIFDIPDKNMWEFSTIDLNFDSNNYMGKSGQA
tara:strand:+ start:3047 stop:3601 length:555 start_codon:yes stop_codon:yes gene_type:complete